MAGLLVDLRLDDPQISVFGLGLLALLILVMAVAWVYRLIRRAYRWFHDVRIGYIPTGSEPDWWSAEWDYWGPIAKAAYDALPEEEKAERHRRIAALTKESLERSNREFRVNSQGLAKTALGRHYIEAGEWRGPTQDFGHLGLAERSPASSSRS